MLSEMLGPKGVAFDNDEVLDDIDDEDLKNDPISQMDMTVRWLAAPRSHTLTLPYPGSSHCVLQGVCLPKYQQLLEHF